MRVVMILLSVGLASSGCAAVEAPPAEEPPCPEEQMLDGEACVPVACGAGEWGWLTEFEPPAPVAWVGDWGDDGNEGTQESPLLTVGAALEQIGRGSGGEIRVAAGDYPSALQGLSSADFSVRGRCREMTTLVTTGPGEAAIVHRGGEVRVRELTVRGGEEWTEGSGYGLAAFDDVLGGATTLVLQRVALEDIVDRPLLVAGNAELIADDLIIRRIRPFGQTFGTGVLVYDDARATLRDVIIEDVVGVGISVESGGWVDLERVVVSEPRGIDLETRMGGLSVVQGGTLVGREVEVSDCFGLCAVAAGAGSTLTLDDSLFARSSDIFDVGSNVGVLSQDGAVTTLRNVRFEDLRGTAASAVFDGNLEIIDSVVTGTRPTVEGTTNAAGMMALEGGHIDVRNTRIEDGVGLGIVADGPGASFAATDVQVVDLASAELGELIDEGVGAGLRVGGGGFGAFERVEILRAEGMGVQVVAAGSRLEGVGLLVSGLSLDPVVGAARGVEISVGGQATLTDARIEDLPDLGILVLGEDASLDLWGSTVSEVRPRGDGSFGVGVDVAEGGRLFAQDLIVETTHTAAVLVNGVDTSAELVNPTLSGITGNALMGVATAVAALGGAVIDVENPQISDAGGPCVYADTGGNLVVRGGTCTRAEFAAGAVVSGGSLDIDGLDVSDLAPSPGEGGTVGVFQWSYDESPCHVTARNMNLSGLSGPFAYARGPGSLHLEGNRVEGSGTVGGMPGGVFVTGGMGAWDASGPEPSGVLVQDNEFVSLLGQAVLLNGASGTFEGNTFSGLDGPAIRWQRCADLEPPQGDDASDVACDTAAQDLGPLLEFNFVIEETGAAP